MTEYEPYGARHFLRDADPEGISELRRHTIPLRDGSTVAEGRLRRHRPRSTRRALGYYRTLVLRRSPAQSRPPSPYRLIWRGDVLRGLAAARGAGAAARRGSRSATRTTPTACRTAPRCAALAARRRPGRRGGRARRWSCRAAIRVAARSTPATRDGDRGRGRGSAAPATYEIWLGGSLRPAARAAGRRRAGGRGPPRAQQRGPVRPPRPAELDAGRAPVEVRIGGARPAPGQRRRRRRARPARRSSSTDAAADAAGLGPGRRGARASAGGHGTGSRSPDERRAEARCGPRSPSRVGAGARRLLGRRPRAARDLPRARRLGDRGHLGPGRLQPRARARGAAGGAARAPRSGRRGWRSPGWSLFGAASLVCGLSGSIELLLAARCVQAVGGAAAVCASLELLPAVVGSERRAATVWAASGALGAALGPGIGGLLTELISWQSIFLVQVPVAAACARGPRRPGAGGALARADRGRARAGRAPAPGRERRPGAGLGGARRGAVPRSSCC